MAAALICVILTFVEGDIFWSFFLFPLAIIFMALACFENQDFGKMELVDNQNVTSEIIIKKTERGPLELGLIKEKKQIISIDKN